jgi:hypothetical protein
MIQSVEQESSGYKAFRIAPAIAQCVMDPFLSISYIEQGTPSFARPQAGYTTFFWVDSDSQGALRIETGLLGEKIISRGSAVGLFCGRGVTSRVSPVGDSVRYLQVEIKISSSKELLDAHWCTVVGSLEKGLSVPGHEPAFQIACGMKKPSFWSDNNEYIHFVGTCDGAYWNQEPFKGTQRKWYIQGVPLQEPLDIFSSLAMCDRVRNRLVLLAYKRGELGVLSG